MADEPISSLANGSPLQPSDTFVVVRSGADYKIVGLPGLPSLVYRYTVTGSAKGSIDTGVDAADAGSNDWTHGDLLEIFIVAQTNDTGAGGIVDLILNNDGGANYDRQVIVGLNASAIASAATAETAMRLTLHGGGGSSGYPGVEHLVIPGYANTSFWKVAQAGEGRPDATAANMTSGSLIFGWRSTAAITRIKIFPETAGKLLSVGSQLLIYKRFAS